MTLYAAWLAAKQAESEAVLKRREIEDQLIAIFGKDFVNGSIALRCQLYSGRLGVSALITER